MRAVLARAGMALLAVAGASPVPALAQSAPPCAACAAAVVGPADAQALLDARIPVAGLDLLFDAAVPGPGTAAALASDGARPWIRAGADGAPALALGGVAGVWLVAPAAGSDEQAVYAVRTASTAIRAAAPEVRVGLELDPRLAGGAVAGALAPYLDAVRVPAALGDTAEAVSRRFGGLDVWLDVADADVLAARTRPGVTRLVLACPDAVALVRRLAALGPWLVPGLTPLPEVRVACDGCRGETFLHPDTLRAIAIVEAAAPPGRLRVEPGAVRVAVVDVDQPGAATPAPVTDGWAALPAGARRLVVEIAGWRGTEDEPYRASVEVSAARQLRVEEILARHQAWRARQDALVRSVISTGTTVLTFEVPGFAGPVTVTAETRVFARGGLVEMEQHAIRMNGVDMSVDGRVPRLPIVEPERVLTPPLAITLGAAYDYRLDGRERASGRDCYVVSFGPRGGGAPSFRGRAWIDAASFALVRMDAAQTNLRGAIVSSRQRDEYAPVAVGDREAWLPARSTSDQLYQAAGLRTPIHREIATASHEVNAADFDARREAVLRSKAVVLRDTPRGYEYLVPAPEGSPAGTVRVSAPRAGRRVVTLAFGVIDDPNITRPLPYAGLSYLDFDFLGRGIQLSGFFGGTYGQAAWTVPSVFRRGWQLTGRVFGIAASYNDRSFEDGVEQYDENILQRPAHADATLVVPLAARVQLRAGYEFDFTRFRPNDDTSPDFVVPADAVVHGARVGLDAQRGAWSALAWWNPARRQGWRPWGEAGSGDYRPGTEDFQRYGVTVGRSWVLSPGSVARLDGTWASGHDLDRFSRYTVDGFDNRLRGYPSASLRYDRGYIARSVVTWTPAGRVRLDGFADLAYVHDPGFGEGLRSYPGLGATAEVPLPARFLLSLEWGYGFNARNTDGSRGTQVYRVAGVKVF